MKKLTIVVIAIVVVAVMLFSSLMGSRNDLVAKQEEVNVAKANVATMLQRRCDLIPNFVETVKAYANHEEDVFVKVAQARSGINEAIDSGDIEKIDEADKAFKSTMATSLNVVVEAYPELKADKQFIALQDELAGSENRIAQARKEYNEVVNDYNKSIKMFPNNIIAGMFGFAEADYFEASAEAETVPVVNFD